MAPRRSACSQAGLVNNLNDGLAWGLFPIFFADHGLSELGCDEAAGLVFVHLGAAPGTLDAREVAEATLRGEVDEKLIQNILQLELRKADFPGYFGVFTASEAAAVGSLYALLVAVLVYRNFGFADLWDCAYRSMRTSMMQPPAW